MKRIGVLTSGGDAPGMNAAIRAVVRAGIGMGMEVFGIEWGYQGLIDGKIQPMGLRSVSNIIGRGGTILKTARCKAFFEPEGRAQGAKQLAERGIEGLVAIGGEGTYHGAAKLHEEHGVRCIGVPGTIDNDIGGTEFTIGFDTALNVAVEAIDRIRDTAAAHGRIFYVEVMGRSCGSLAMMSGIAGGAEHILIPETPTDIKELADGLRDGVANGKTSSIVVVAEGDDAGKAFDVAAKVAAISEFKEYRVAVIGHIQRGGSPTAFDRILASRLGVRAVEALAEGETGKMAGLMDNKVVLRPFTEAWLGRSRFDPSYPRLAATLAR